MTFEKIWNSETETEWNQLLKQYWAMLNVDNIQIEFTLARLTPSRIAEMDKHSWFDFLHDEYFLWKFTAKNRLATTRTQLRRHKEEGELELLDRVRRQLLKLDPDAIGDALKEASRIRGLGVAGASGLLSLIHPKHFATVDQFVVKALLEVPEHRTAVESMKPEGLSVRDGVKLTQIMRGKAVSMNSNFNSRFWTPRTIEMALWAYRS